MTGCDLSVIITNWNTRELLRQCLESVAASLHVMAEVIVVDNGSGDGSIEMLAADFPKVRVIANRQNRGFAAANNQGLALAQGRYLLLLNSDTLVAPDALTQLVKFMDAHSDAGACGPQLRNQDGTLQPSGRAFPSLLTATIALLPVPSLLRRMTATSMERRDYSQVAAVDEVSGAALCLRREALAQTGGLDEDFFFLGEDVELCWRLHKAGWVVYYVPQAVITHLWGGSRKRLSEQTSLYAQRSFVLLFRKHRPGLPTKLITLLVRVLTLAKAARRIVPVLLHGQRSRARDSWQLYRAELAWLGKR